MRRLVAQRYRDAGMDFADACVLRLAQLQGESLICTTDSDFNVYLRPASNQTALLAPFAT